MKKIVTACGYGISYIQKGEGDDLVFLHGYLACKETFAHQIKYFSKHYRVTAFDFPGFGDSQDINSPLSVSDYTDITIEILNKLGIKKANFIAHSFGARVLIKVCAKAPERAQDIVFTGAAGLKPKFSLKKKLKIFWYKLIKGFISEKSREKYGSSDYKQLTPVMKRSFNKIISEDLKVYLKDIKSRTLIVCGRVDKDTPVYMAKRLHKKIAGSQLYIMENCGHFAFIDRAVEFNSLVKSFLLSGKGKEI